MATFEKKEKEKKRLKKKQEKLKKREERKANSKGGSLENMMAYVDEFGNITDTPPDPETKEEINVEDIVIGASNRNDGAEEEETAMKGRVEFFNTGKGFGFIKDQNGRDKYFVHVNNTLEPIGEGDIVTFEVEQGPRGLNAVNVSKVQ